MQGRAPAFIKVVQDEEVASTSCAEEAPHVHEPTSARSVIWKAVALAAATVLVAAAGVTWTHGRADAGQVVGLQEITFDVYETIGCRNWKEIESSRSVVVDKAACQAICEADPACTSFNFQAVACEPGWYVDNGCIIFNGSCNAERNKCWSWNHKPLMNTVTQSLVVTSDGTAEETGTKVLNALAASGVEDATITEVIPSLPEEAARRLQGTMWKITWQVVTSSISIAKEVAQFATDLAESQFAREQFMEQLESAEPLEVAVTELAEVDLPVTEFPSEPDYSTTTAAPEVCSSEYDSCLETLCCEDEGLWCYQKDAFWAGCRPDCTAGIHEGDPEEYQTPWSCNLLDPDPNAPQPNNHTEPDDNCSAQEESCAETMCCSSPYLWCYEKNSEWAGCLTSCTVGINPYDPIAYQTPWSCTVLDPDPNAPDPIDPITTSEEGPED